MANNIRLQNAMQTTRSIAKMATQLAHLPEIERLSPRVIRILAGNPGKVRAMSHEENVANHHQFTLQGNAASPAHAGLT
jgi:DNA uptake protein ComE-like DNA-binding protein